MSQVWVVEIRIDDNDPQVVGPYTETQQRRSARAAAREAQLEQAW